MECLEERMDRLKHEIRRSIVSEETFGRYKQLQEDLYSQMVHENEEFNKLHQVVEETRKRFDAGNLHRKEIRTYDLLLTITRKLETVHSEYSHLLKLKNTTLQTAWESLYYSGV